MSIPVILHHSDYRGDHAADVRTVVILPEAYTLKDLLALVVDKKCAAWIEVTQVEKPGTNGGESHG